MQTAPTWPSTPEEVEKTRARFERFSEFAARYKADASLRARLEGGDVSASLAELGLDLPADVNAKIVADTPETLHFVMPSDPNISLTDEALNISAAGKTVSSAGSVGTFACSSAPSSASSVGSIGTASDLGMRPDIE